MKRDERLLAAGIAHPPAQLGVVDQRGQRLGQPLGRRLRHQPARHSIVHDLRRAAARYRNHRTAHCKRLQHHEAEGLGVRGIHCHVHELSDRHGIVAVAGERRPGRRSEASSRVSPARARSRRRARGPRTQARQRVHVLSLAAQARRRTPSSTASWCFRRTTPAGDADHSPLRGDASRSQPCSSGPSSRGGGSMPGSARWTGLRGRRASCAWLPSGEQVNTTWAGSAVATRSMKSPPTSRSLPRAAAGEGRRPPPRGRR